MNSGAWVLCVLAADELGNWQDETNATKTSINYSTSGTVAVLKNDLEAYYNQSNAPGAINNPLEVEVNGVDGKYKFAYGLANTLDCASASYSGPFNVSVNITGILHNLGEGLYKLYLLGEDSLGTQTMLQSIFGPMTASLLALMIFRFSMPMVTIKMEIR